MKSSRAIEGYLRRVTSSFVGDKNGVAAIEFAFVALPFFAILIAIFEIGLVFLAANELETAVEKAGRQLLTGQAQQGGVTQSQFISSVCSNLPVFFTCSGVMVDLEAASAFASANTSAPSLTYNSSGQVTNTWNFDTGAAGSILVLRVFYQFPVLPAPLGLNLANLPNGTRLLMATSVFQVEPYSSGS
jgi:Flp pilus assembly protein TadG